MAAMANRSILVIDDEESVCLAFRRFFERRDWAVRIASSGAQGTAQFASQSPDVVFLDVRLPDCDGVDVLAGLREADPRVPVIIITAYGGLETVTRSLDGRAFDYLPKPIDLDEAERVALRAVASSRVSDGEDAGGAALPTGEADIVGASRAMQNVYKRIAVLSRSNCSVLILGETGTGKEIVARAIHAHSPRKDKPFLAVNCGALPSPLAESELFGHVRGAFTGADSDRIGKFEAANGGTLFLDEVGELPEAVQVKLLRAVDQQTIERVGSTQSRKLDVRVIAATNRNLFDDVEAGQFRADLYYRLAVVQLELPRLVDRPEDILPLARHFLATGAGPREPVPQHDETAEQALLRYGWPGNVRELKNAMEHVRALAPGRRVTVEDLPPTLQLGHRLDGPGAGGLDAIVHKYVARFSESVGELHREAMQPLERAIIQHALRRCHGNQSQAADLLGLHRNTLRKKIRELDLNDEVSHGV
jgi:DNA-binding NtrC family response regulator